MDRTDNRKQAEVWARRFTRELTACETVAEWGEVIALNGANLGHCEQYNAPLYAQVKGAIKTAVERIEACQAASSSNAPSAKKEDANTPTTSTDPSDHR